MDRTLECLVEWVPQQRWYVGKGRVPDFALVGDIALGDRARVLLVSDAATSPPVIYQIPVVRRAVGGDDAHVIGSPAPDVVLVDGPHDENFTKALLALLRGGGEGALLVERPEHPSVPQQADARVLGGEQSNTSIVFSGDATAPAIVCKIYRVLHPGTNPDVEVQSALTRVGAPHIAPVVASVSGRWRGDGADERGTLAFAQAFIADGEDGWRLAVRTAAAGTDFRTEAALLGSATAEVHSALAAAFGTTPSDPARSQELVAAWFRRLSDAIAEVPALATHREAIEDVYRRAGSAAWPALQRIHGDFHLGQALHSRTLGWVLLDFEGEPLRPFSERIAPDLVLRDVAGMLRSFDYVAGSIDLGSPGAHGSAAHAWAASARTAFLSAYQDATGPTTSDAETLLRALELDKALYEAVYEARSRPSWLPIPLQAIVRLTEAHPAR